MKCRVKEHVDLYIHSLIRVNGVLNLRREKKSSLIQSSVSRVKGGRDSTLSTISHTWPGPGVEEQDESSSMLVVQRAGYHPNSPSPLLATYLDTFFLQRNFFIKKLRGL
jgi:hypothetical protein